MNKQQIKVLFLFIVIGLIIIGIVYFVVNRDSLSDDPYYSQYLIDLTNGNASDYIVNREYDSNEYVNVELSDQQMASIYLNDFYNMMFEDINEAYQLLDSSFVEENDITLDDFSSFASMILATPNALQITGYTTERNSSQNLVQYDIITANGIHYTFLEKGIMVYSVSYDSNITG